MDPEAGSWQVQGVADLLGETEFVDGFVYVDRETTWAEFVDYYVDEPEIVELVSADLLPTSFRVQTSEPVVVIDLLSGLDGVETVEVTGSDR